MTKTPKKPLRVVMTGRFAPSLDPPQLGDIRVQMSRTNRILSITKFHGGKGDIIFIERYYTDASDVLIFR